MSSQMVAEPRLPREVALNVGGRPGDTEAVESRRAARRIIASVEQEKHAAYAREYDVKVEGGSRRSSVASSCRRTRISSRRPAQES